MLLLVVTGYVAIVKAPAALAVPAMPAETMGSTFRRWWETLDSGYAGRLAAAVGAIVVVLIGTAPMVAASVNNGADPALAEALNGAPQALSAIAPQFHLIDQYGQPISLSDLRGYTVAMTFLDPVCTTDCPVIAQEFRVASQLLGSAASKVRFVAIAANPQYHSVAVIDDFDRDEGLDSQSNWLYLTGSTAVLSSVLRSYGVTVANGPAGSMTIHADMAFVIDGQGTTRWALNADPGANSADHSSFSSLLVSEIENVMHS
jgi:cytochrome oxidase Cu insertion factor (SCO1/SenC/PrrC family)